MENQEKQPKLRTLGQIIAFLLIACILISGLRNKISLDWKGFVFLAALEVLLVVPWVMEINFFDLFKIEKGLNDIDSKLQSIEMKLDVSSSARAQSITYVMSSPERPLMQKENETGGSTPPTSIPSQNPEQSAPAPSLPIATEASSS